MSARFRARTVARPMSDLIPPISDFSLREGLLLDVLRLLVALSVFVERGLALVFEHSSTWTMRIELCVSSRSGT